MTPSPKICTCLWFDGSHDAEAAAALYCSLIPGSDITAVSRYGKGAPMPEGSPMVVKFHLAGVPYMLLNGGPYYKLTAAASIVVEVSTQAEIDHLWSALTADGGKELQCGWLTDRYGVSWQIVPAQLGAWMTNPDRAISQRVMTAFMAMKKFDIAALERAAKG